MVAPKGSLEVHEEAWNAYPYCKTVLSNPGYMKVSILAIYLSIYLVSSQDNFYIVIETYHIGDRGHQDNVHELDDKKLKARTVVPIDIANDEVASTDFKKDEDPTTYKSEKTGRGPLSGDWKVGTQKMLPCIQPFLFFEIFPYQCTAIRVSIN